MLPSLQNGSIVNISVDWDCYKFGDIVLIEWGTIFVVHRLVDVRTMRTKGDNLTHFDPEGLKIVGFISSISTHSERLGTFLSKIEGQFYCNSKHNSKSCKMFFKVLSSLKYLLLKRKKKNELKQ